MPSSKRCNTVRFREHIGTKSSLANVPPLNFHRQITFVPIYPP